MAYVALSRVKSLDKLYLIDFDPQKLICNPKEIKEIYRLRKLYMPELPQITEFNNIKKSKDKDNMLSNNLKRPLIEISYSNTNKKQKTNNFADSLMPLHTFLLINNANVCYSNSILQSLLSLGSVFNMQVINYYKSSKFVIILSKSHFLLGKQ